MSSQENYAQTTKKKKLYTSVNQDKGYAEIEWREKEKKPHPQPTK